MRLCANCGTSESDGIKLKICTACKSVRYCGIKCQKEHRPKHKQACKKRVAELRDEILFKQPESSHLGDCPICCLPTSLDLQKSNLMTCCSQILCCGCIYANRERQFKERVEQNCPFCRTPLADSDAEHDKRTDDRAAMNDPIALCQVGMRSVRDGEYTGAIKYLSKAAELGDSAAHNELAIIYDNGRGVERNKIKSIVSL